MYDKFIAFSLPC